MAHKKQVIPGSPVFSVYLLFRLSVIHCHTPLIQWQYVSVPYQFPVQPSAG